MFGIGSFEILVIFLVALLVLGPKKLPKLAHTIGRAMNEFRRVSTEFQRTLNTEIAFEEEAEKKKARKEAERKAAAGEEKSEASSETSTSDPDKV